ncbi:MAG: lysozyme [Candidatus Thiothrix sulfatifontis]|nr:MAG: lysozyme [Candidatus Thiothrix sulfatifontis]
MSAIVNRASRLKKYTGILTIELAERQAKNIVSQHEDWQVKIIGNVPPYTVIAIPPEENNDTDEKSASLFFLSNEGKALLQSIEKLNLKPYDDQTSKQISKWIIGATIGYGHLIERVEWDSYKNGITKAEAENLFFRDLQPFVKLIRESIDVNIKQHQFDALVMFAFNIGIGGFKGSSVLKIINGSFDDNCADELKIAWKAWNKSQGVINNGLINRRKCELNIYFDAVYKRW